MDRIAFVFRTDVHAADRAPISWKGDYRAEILDNLRQVGVLARLHAVDAVLDGGDFFHVKKAERTSHYLNSKVIKLHKEYPCETFSVEGNHDVVGDNLDSVEKQPLGVLYEAGTFHLLREEVFEKGSLRVRVVGVPYDPTLDLRKIQAIRKQPGDTHLVAVIHALAAEDPPATVEEFFGEPVFRYASLVYDQGPDVFMFGHWHRDQGVVEIKGRYFVNQGALSRGALTRENVDRTPKVSLVEFTPEGIKVTVLPLQVAPASEVFDFDRKEREDTEQMAISQFVEELQMSSIASETQDFDKALTSMDFAPEVAARAAMYLERARTD